MLAPAAQSCNRIPSIALRFNNHLPRRQLSPIGTHRIVNTFRSTPCIQRHMSGHCWKPHRGPRYILHGSYRQGRHAPRSSSLPGAMGMNKRIVPIECHESRSPQARFAEIPSNSGWFPRHCSQQHNPAQGWFRKGIQHIQQQVEGN